MAAVPLFWNTNMAAVTSCENALYAWYVAAKAVALSLRSVWCHINHVNAHASDATIINYIRFASTRSSGTHCTAPAKGETVQFALPAWNPFIQESESRDCSQLSAECVFGKIGVLAKSRNRCRLSIFGFHYSAWFLYFYTFPSMLRRLSSESFNKL